MASLIVLVLAGYVVAYAVLRPRGDQGLGGLAGGGGSTYSTYGNPTYHAPGDGDLYDTYENASGTGAQSEPGPGPRQASDGSDGMYASVDAMKKPRASYLEPVAGGNAAYVPSAAGDASHIYAVPADPNDGRRASYLTPAAGTNPDYSGGGDAQGPMCVHGCCTLHARLAVACVLLRTRVAVAVAVAVAVVCCCCCCCCCCCSPA